MSKFTRVKTKIRVSDLRDVCRALDELGVEYEYSRGAELGYDAYTHREQSGAYIAIRKGMHTIKYSDGTMSEHRIAYEDTVLVEGDDGYLTWLHSVHSSNEFVEAINRNVAEQKIRRVAAAQGFQITHNQETVLQDGSRQKVLRLRVGGQGQVGQLDAVIGDGGQFTAEMQGIKGDACAPIIGAINKAMGEVEDEENTPEFYEGGGSGAGRGVGLSG